MKAILSGLVGACLTAFGSAQAQIHGDARNGRALAEQWCASCHMVSPEQTVASPDLPSFMDIAERAEGEFEPLRAFLADPHPVMPDMSLTRQEIRDLVAYIASLQSRRE